MNSANPTIGDSILIRLLQLDVSHDKKLKKLEQLISVDNAELHLDGLLDIVLDVLGVPPDNTVETDAVNIANTTGKWPEGSYSRDPFYDAWFAIKRGQSETTVEKFPEWVRAQLRVQ